MQKTSVYLTPDEVRHLRSTAARTGRSQAELIREGVRLVTAQSNETRRTFHSLGKGRGGGAPYGRWEADELYRSVTGRG
jgi:Arc/MetJ-type ribon-helix-helix transcriptional regulator